MTEIALKLMLLRYNMLSRERAKIADMCALTGDYSKWADCMDEMKKMEDELCEYGYKFVYVGYKAAGEGYYSVYEIVPINCR